MTNNSYLAALQQRAESRAVIAAAFAEAGRFQQARIWAAKSETTWQEWIQAQETA